MTQFTETPTKTWEADGAIALHARCKLDADGKVTVCDAVTAMDGTAVQEAFAAGDKIAVRLRSAQGTRKMIAADAITTGDTVYAAAAGKVTNEPTSAVVEGKAYDTAAADGDIIEVGPAGTGGAEFAGGLVVEEITFTEAGDTTYTGTVEIPAGATVLDIILSNVVLWDDGTSAAITIGDDDDADGWLTSTSLKATDMLVGEVFRASAAGDGTNSPGNHLGKAGAYIVEATGRWGRTTAGVDGGAYYGAASEIIGVVTTGGQDGTAGRTRMTVMYALPRVTAATGA